MDLNSASIHAEWVGNDEIIVTDNINNRLVLRITNISGEIIEIGINDNIKLYFPVGDKEYHFITEKGVKDIICTPSYNWECKFDEENYTWGMFPKKSLKVQDGESIVIVFTNIISNKNYLYANMSCLNIYLKHNGIEDAPIQLPVFMNVAPAKINKFICSNSVVGILDEITFTWETTGASADLSYNLVNCEGVEETASLNPKAIGNYQKNGIFLLPDFAPDLNLKFKPQDSIKCTVMETTNYTLLVSNDEKSATEIYPIYVLEPKIVDFGFVRREDMITLSFTLENTFHCYINCGVGRVNCTPDYSNGYCISKGSVTVKINKYIGIYELSCLGQNGLISKTLTVPRQ